MAALNLGRFRKLSEAFDAARRGTFMEEAGTTADFPELLKSGLRALMFSEFAGIPTEWDSLVQVVPSNMRFETWIKNQGIGTLPKVGEGSEYQALNNPDLKPEIVIENSKYGGILSITEEMLKFDQYGMIQQNIRELANAAAQTREEAVMGVMTTVGNYTATAADNSAGADNHATTGLSPVGFAKAHEILTTMTDRSSGRPLGIRPDTLIVTPTNEFYARQLFTSPTIRSGGADDVHGSGTRNPFFIPGLRVMVSHWLQILGTTHPWILGQAKRGLVLQEVEGMQLLDQRAEASNEAYIMKDTFRFRVRDWFGVGFTDSRFWYYANSTTTPAVD